MSAIHLHLAYEVAHAEGKELLGATDQMQLFSQVLAPGEEIPAEIHEISSQFFYMMSGQMQIDTYPGEDEVEGYVLGPNQSLIVPAGLRHRVINVSSSHARFFTIYAPPH